MLQTGLGDETIVGTAPGGKLLPVGPTGVTNQEPIPSIYQVVQETAVGPKFLTSWDTQEAAMRDCRALNICSGNPFKTVLWGTGTPCLRCSAKQIEFQKDNKLPSFVLHAGGVKNYPEAMPVSAVYNHGTEVIFLPDGTGTPTNLANFTIGDLPEQMDYVSALEGAKHLAMRSGKRVTVKVKVNSRKGRRTMPVTKVIPTITTSSNGMSAIPGMIDMNPIVSPVTPLEFQRLIKMSQQFTDDL